MSGHVKDFPTVVIPFESRCESEICQDVCVYLRPETNGVQVESTMMRTIQGTPLYSENVKLVYLANLPGEFISRRRIIEHHYRLKILFAKKGKRLFTEYMRREFSRYFKTDFGDAWILGSFEAMKKLGFSREDLFNIWVDKKEILHLNGQTIKHFGEYYIINYDIPALLLKNRTNTDVAVMILRTKLGPKTVHTLMMDMVDALKRNGYLHESDNFTRVFHFSRSPFEQILDSIGFLYDAEGSHVALRKIRFYNYLLKNGIDALTIRKFLEYPVFGFENEKGRYFEETIYAATYGLGYEDAFRKLNKAKTQVLLD